MKLGAIIHQYRKAHELSMDAMALRSGLSKAYIAILENERNPISGKPSKPSLETIQKLAKAMGTSTDDLISMMDGDDLVTFDPAEEEADKEGVPVQLPYPVSTTSIPLYDEISCGTGLFVDDQITEMFTIPTSMLPNKRAEYFAQTAHGDSMTGAGIKDGDILIFKKTSSIENGQIGCFCIDDNVAMCKKFSQNGGSVYLMPANDKYPLIPIEPENQCFRVIGLLVAQVSKR